jgi:bifunctional oligoribonuclease and PAP phosphatase NrnA
MSISKTISQQIYQQLRGAQKILIISHRNPDGDTLGSNLALNHYLQKQHKEVVSFCPDPLPEFLKFLPQSQTITNDHRVFTAKYDVLITVDCADKKMTMAENLIAVLPRGFTFINIDHHISNTHYGDTNLVLSTASSTAEIIYELFHDWNISWDTDLATDLACGLITDTGGLKNPATSYQTIMAVADLISKGANLQNIIKTTLQEIELDRLRLFGRALERLTKVEKYNLVYTWITKQDLLESDSDESATEGISNFLHILNEGKVILVLKESGDGDIKGSLRTTSNIDLTKLAGFFGGGGHKKAAGFSLSGRLVYDNNKLRVI